MNRPGACGYKIPRRGRRRLVRCLGPGTEHFFPSIDPVRNRICPECAKKLMHVVANEKRFQIVRD